MKILSTLLFFLTCLAAQAQKDTILHIHKFPNGKISTLVVLKDDREGYAKAFDFSGKVIYHNYVRRFGGHSSVTFKHHPNGMVSEAHYSSQPDGGIQWYRSWTSFDDKGNKLDERHENWDDRLTIPTYKIRDSIYTSPVVPIVQPNPSPKVEPKKPEPKPDKPETIACAVIHRNKTAFINHSNQKILLHISHAGKDTLIVLGPRKTYSGPTYITAQIAGPLTQNIRYQFNATKKNRVIDSATDFVALSPEETLHRVHFYARRK